MRNCLVSSCGFCRWSARCFGVSRRQCRSGCKADVLTLQTFLKGTYHVLQVIECRLYPVVLHTPGVSIHRLGSMHSIDGSVQAPLGHVPVSGFACPSKKTDVVAPAAEIPLL